MISGEASPLGRSPRGKDGHRRCPQGMQGQGERAAGVCPRRTDLTQVHLFHGRRRQRSSCHGTGRLRAPRRQCPEGRPPARRLDHARDRAATGPSANLMDMLLRGIAPRTLNERCRICRDETLRLCHAFIAEAGVKHVFMLPGGGAMHLNDSLGNARTWSLSAISTSRRPPLPPRPMPA